jgi:hypothetical protein
MQKADELTAIATAKLTVLFSNFSNPDTYMAAFGMMDDGECRLIDIQDVACRIGIAPSVIAMRRSDWVRK